MGLGQEATLKLDAKLLKNLPKKSSKPWKGLIWFYYLWTWGRNSPGAAPVIAEIARSLGILTVGVVI